VTMAGPWPASTLTHFMSLALGQARAAAEHGDIPVGAVVVSAQGGVVALGRNRREIDFDPTAHAEVVALRAAAELRGDWQLADCTLLVTLEPCVMCAGALVQARIARLVFGAWDLKGGAAGSQWDLIRDRRLSHRPEVVGGILEDECAAVIEAFFAALRSIS
jgi:tRNA(adenine34) deaminase